MLDSTPDRRQASGHFAVPLEEVGKLVEILQDVTLDPEAGEIRALTNPNTVPPTDGHGGPKSNNGAE